MQEPGGSRENRIANVVGTVVAIAGAIIASPVAVARLPEATVAVLKTVVTLGNTIQPAAATIAGIVIAAVTHPPRWLAAAGHNARRMLPM